MDKRQMLILVDENDNPTGEYADKGECHFGEGLHHRAFVVVLLNNKNEVLLQKRKHVRWDRFWDVAAISHVLHLGDAPDDRNESYEEAGLRALKDEMGITGVVLKKIAGFNYFAKYHSHCENEYCAILIGEYSGDVNPNYDLVYEYKWVARDKFFDDVENDPEKYTPWAIETAKLLKTNE